VLVRPTRIFPGFASRPRAAETHFQNRSPNPPSGPRLSGSKANFPRDPRAGARETNALIDAKTARIVEGPAPMSANRTPSRRPFVVDRQRIFPRMPPTLHSATKCWSQVDVMRDQVAHQSGAAHHRRASSTLTSAPLPRVAPALRPLRGRTNIKSIATLGNYHRGLVGPIPQATFRRRAEDLENGRQPRRQRLQWVRRRKKSSSRCWWNGRSRPAPVRMLADQSSTTTSSFWRRSSLSLLSPLPAPSSSVTIPRPGFLGLGLSIVVDLRSVYAAA